MTGPISDEFELNDAVGPRKPEAEDVEEALQAVLTDADVSFETALTDVLGHDYVYVEGVTTFMDAMLMTRDRGVILHLSDGSEWQLSLVRRA